VAELVDAIGLESISLAGEAGSESGRQHVKATPRAGRRHPNRRSSTPVTHRSGTHTTPEGGASWQSRTTLRRPRHRRLRSSPRKCWRARSNRRRRRSRRSQVPSSHSRRARRSSAILRLVRAVLREIDDTQHRTRRDRHDAARLTRHVDLCAEWTMARPSDFARPLHPTHQPLKDRRRFVVRGLF